MYNNKKLLISMIMALLLVLTGVFSQASVIEAEDDQVTEEIETETNGTEETETNNDTYTLTLTLNKARDRIIEESRDAERAKMGLDRGEIGVNRARSSLSDLEDDIEELEDDEEDLLDERSELREDIEELKLKQMEDNNGENEDIEGKIMEKSLELEFTTEELIALSQQISNMEDNIPEAEQAVEEAEQRQELAEMDWESTQEVMKFGAESSYVMLLSLKEQISALEEGITTLERVHEEEQKKQEIGESTPLQVDMIELEKLEMENTLMSFEENYAEMERDFLDSLGYPLDEHLELIDISYDLEEFEEELDVNEIIERALDVGKEMNIADTELKYAEENMEWARDEYSYGTNDYREYELDLQEAKLDKEETEQNLKKSIYQAYNTFNEELRNYRIAKQNLTVEEEVLRGEKLQEEYGMSTQKQVLDAKVQVEEANRNLRQAEYQAYLAKRELELLEQGYLVDMPEGNGSMNGDSDAGDRLKEERVENGDMDQDINQDGPPR